MIFEPQSIGSLNLTNPYYPEEIQASYDEAMINDHQRQDGNVIDYNYGFDAATKPMPFNISVLISASSADGVFIAEKALHDLIGKKELFTGKSPGGGYTVTATVTIRSIAADYTASEDPLQLPVTIHFKRWTKWNVS